MDCLLWFCPPFSIFLTHVTTCAPQLPMPPTYSHATQHVLCHVPSNHGAHPHLSRTHMHYPHLSHTHMHYPLRASAPLVPIGCAETHYHILMTHSPLTHSSTSISIQFPHLVCFLIPIMLLIAHISDHISLISCFPMTHMFHLHHTSLLLWSTTILSFVLPSHSDSDSDLDTYINPWETSLCLSSLTWSLIRVLSSPTSLYCVCTGCQ
jgi:hypothetical protein